MVVASFSLNTKLKEKSYDWAVKSSWKATTVELHWLENLRDHGNMFEIRVVRASEC